MGTSNQEQKIRRKEKVKILKRSIKVKLNCAGSNMLELF